MRYSWLSLLPLLAACNSNPSAVQEGASTPTAGQPARDTATALPPPDTARAKAASASNDTLRVIQAFPHFTHTNKKAPYDVFRLVYRGPSVLEGTAEFTITDESGQVVFREILTEPDLEAALVYELKTPTATPAEREAYVLRRIDQFFWPAQFRTPAVATGATFPTGLANLDRATWADLQKRHDAVGFEYLKGKEDRRVIAWSPLKKQTVRVR